MSAPTPHRKINLSRVAHVYYNHANISAAHGFLLDFGFTPRKQVGKKTYYRGHGAEPFVYCAEEGDKDSFGGAAFVVETEEDLKLASSVLPGATQVYEMEDAPGCGKAVTFHDPVDGFPFHLVWGQKPVEPLDDLTELRFNFPNEKHRSVNEFQRFKKGPCAVHKLGHFGMCVTSYKKAYEFYTTFFNFKASDIIYDDSDKDMTTFLHLDRGENLVDHHCFFFFEGPVSHIHHSSYEVHDFDRQVLGHEWLQQKGYENCWGVGRHVPGSQIFDYWFDPSRFIMEHYSDGDLVNCHNPTFRSKAGPNSLYIWGPEVPGDFLE